jgi:hypothetical protein
MRLCMTCLMRACRKKVKQTLDQFGDKAGKHGWAKWAKDPAIMATICQAWQDRTPDQRLLQDSTTNSAESVHHSTNMLGESLLHDC